MILEEECEPRSQSDWDLRFLSLADHIGSWSKDPSTQVGTVIVDPKRRILGMGYNGFPRGVVDSSLRLSSRETKYLLMVHSETNAILNSIRDLDGATLYCSSVPCAECTKLIIQSGIRRVVYPRPESHFLARWPDETTKLMLEEAGVERCEV